MSIRKTIARVAAVTLVTSYASVCLAQTTGGLAPVVNTGNNVIATLDALAPVIMLAAVVIAGILIVFRVAGIGVVASVLGGGVLIAGAPEIVTWFGL